MRSHHFFLSFVPYGLLFSSCLAIASFAIPSPVYAQEQNENTRVMWQIQFADGLSKQTKKKPKYPNDHPFTRS